MVNFIALGLLTALIILLILKKKKFKHFRDYNQEVNANLCKSDVRKDGIKRIDNPHFLNANVKVMGNFEVFAIIYKGKAFAFPVNTLTYHEILNFDVDKEDISITYCPLSGTARAFKGHKFGITGKLYNLNLVMYDIKTNSEVPQILGKAYNGKLNGKNIPRIHTYRTTWNQWKKLYPNSKILSLSKNKFKMHKFNLYPWYDFILRFWYPLKAKSQLLRSKEIMICFEFGKKYYAFQKNKFKKNRTLTIQKRKISIIFLKQLNDIEIFQGKSRIDSFETFWFAWYACHPDTVVL